MPAGELRVYNGQHLMSSTQLSSPYNAMTFGKYGREESTLIGVMKSGIIAVCLLRKFLTQRLCHIWTHPAAT